MTGLFVTFEGIEGSGKSTAIRSVATTLMAEGYEVLATREPGDGPVGARIRSLLLEGEDLAHMAEVFLFLADRAQHVESLVRPALAQGKIVLCDRYADSTVVYQGYARGLDIENLRQWNIQATGGLQADLTLLLDLDVPTGLARQTKADRMDREPAEFHEKVRGGFLSEAAKEPARWVVVDGSKEASSVAAECVSKILEVLSRQ